jgi:hypothetical protein
MMHQSPPSSDKTEPSPPSSDKTEPTDETCPQTTACPVCGGRLIEIRGKLQCARCRTICETCCEGGRG